MSYIGNIGNSIVMIKPNIQTFCVEQCPYSDSKENTCTEITKNLPIKNNDNKLNFVEKCDDTRLIKGNIKKII